MRKCACVQREHAQVCKMGKPMTLTSISLPIIIFDLNAKNDAFSEFTLNFFCSECLLEIPGIAQKYVTLLRGAVREDLFEVDVIGIERDLKAVEQ